MPATPPITFGVTFTSGSSHDDWRTKLRRAEDLGFDVIQVADHLGLAAPFPVLSFAAAVTQRPRLGTFVLNSGFYSPALLAREVATVGQLAAGRLELGLGVGYVRAEFDQAGVPFEPAGKRIDKLERVLAELDTHNSPTSPDQQSRVTLLIGGNGDRILKLAAHRADIVGLSGVKAVAEANTDTMRLLTSSELDERCEYVRRHSAHRATAPTLNLVIPHVVVTNDRLAAAEHIRLTTAPDTTIEQILDAPSRLIGTAVEIADQLRAHRQRFGISYFTILHHALEEFAPVIPLLRHQQDSSGHD